MNAWRRTLFSPDRIFRYTLWRDWLDFHKAGFVMFVGLNPSTADETRDDPTVRRCIDYAKRWGFGSLCMTNLFAFRATDPEVMKAAGDPVGPRNDRILRSCASAASLIVAAWGNDGEHLDRGRKVLRMLPYVHVFEMTKRWQPCHPLYKKKTIFPVRLSCLEK